MCGSGPGLAYTFGMPTIDLSAPVAPVAPSVRGIGRGIGRGTIAVILAAALLQSALASAQSPTNKPATNKPAASKPAKTGQKAAVDLSASCKDLDPALLDPEVDAADRTATDWLVGFRLPEPPSTVSWLDAPAPGPDAFRGKVAIFMNTGSGGTSRREFETLQKSLGDLAASPEVLLFALHTPDGAKQAARSAQRKPWGAPVAVDGDGAWCDSLGLFKDPVVIAVDKRGDVRAVGLSVEGAATAVKALLAEPFDPASDKPTERPAAPPPADASTISYPDHATAGPMVGTEAPQMAVERWAKDPVADAAGKVVVLDFWEPWCSPCRAAIPHMNEMQRAYMDDVVCVGVSGMTNSDFEQDCNKYKLKVRDFAYGLAISPGKSMHSALGVTGYPTVFVVSGDWKVRWQGHPTALTDAVLGPIVQANRKQQAALHPAGPAAHRKDTWASKRK